MSDAIGSMTIAERIEAAPARVGVPAEERPAPAANLGRLAQALHRVKQACPMVPVLGIRWMHLRHPLHPVQEALLRGAGWRAWLERRGPARERRRWAGGRWEYAMLLRRVAHSVITLGVLMVRLIRLRAALWRELSALSRERFEVVLRTMCFGPARLANDQDFYFGDLQQRLEARGVRTLLVCRDVKETPDWVAYARGHMTRLPVARLPELALVPLSAPLALWGQQLVACARLRRLARRLEDPAAKRAARLASQDCLAPDSALSALAYWAGRAIVQRWHPQAIGTLYEGHAWETCARLGIKRADPACRTIGYQHTVVFSESLALLAPDREAGERTVPDVVLGLGPVPINLMRPGHAPHGTAFVRFGSFRYRPVRVEAPADPARRTVLVTPEGLTPEVERLFRFVAACAAQLPHDTFILRCHPEVPMEQALRLLPDGLLDLPNIVRSDRRTIEEDFPRASILLYRGSSAVLYAVLHGLRPVYYEAPDTRECDPLYAMPGWRQRCATPEGLAARLQADAAQPAAERAAEWRAAAAYVEGCTGPVDAASVDALLAAVGRQARQGS